MRKLIIAISLVALALVGCNPVKEKTVNKPAVRLFAPETNESGTVRAYEGDAVTLTGFNLNNVTTVKFEYTAAGVDKVIETVIATKEINTLVFAIPAMPEFAQDDAPYPTMFRVYYGEEVIYSNQFFVTVPVTDVVISGLSQTGVTIGGEVTITGRNLDKVTSIVIHSVTLTEFTSRTASEIKFALPVAAYAAGTSQEEITVNWDKNGSNALIIPLAKLNVLMPFPELINPISTAALGDEIEITGENLNLLDSVYIGAYKMVIVDRAADGTAMTVRIPGSIPQQSPAVVHWNIVGYFGVPKQSCAIFNSYPLDTTPLVIPVTPPTMTSITMQDGGATNKAYLKKVATVAGTHLLNVTGITIGGITATIKAGATDSQLQFIIPETFAFTTATDAAVVAAYQDGTVAFGNLTVYPFYFYPNLTIGGHAEANAAIAFLVPDSGRVCSTAEWAVFDYIAAANNGSGLGGAVNVIDKAVITSAAMYYSVPTYLFAYCSTAPALSFNSPSNSNSVLKNYKTWVAGVGTAICGTTIGTPMMRLRNLYSAGSETTYADAVRDGTLTGIANGNLPSSSLSTGAPTYASPATGNGNWDAGSVVWFAQANYAISGTTIASTDIYKCGYIHVKAVSGTSPLSTASTITFDLYWSRVINP